jgi:transcriptional regulator with XRE-family HTH domain
MGAMTTAMTRVDGNGVGPLLREWRRRRNLSQLELALRADSSARHLSFLETGRAQPSRSMLLRLADELEVPVRHRNTLLIAAGYAPVYETTPLGSPRTRAVDEAIARLLKTHEPYPAVAVDADENIVLMNQASRLMLENSNYPPELLKPPINTIRLSLHPQGMAQRVINLAEWRRYLLQRVHRQIIHSGRESLRTLYEEVLAYPCPDQTPVEDTDDIVAFLRLRAPEGELRLFGTITTFGASTDITISELSLEFFHPADEYTRNAFHAYSAQTLSAA